MYNPFTDFIMPKNKSRFLGKGCYAHPAKFIAVEKRLHLLWQNPTPENRHKTP